MALKEEKSFFIFKKKIIEREDGKEYLIRYSFPTCKWLPFSLKIHKIILSDNLKCLHDHPWKFWSFILKGGYYEYTPCINQHKFDVTSNYNGTDMVKKWYGPFSFLRRPAHWIHGLEIPDGNPAWTFVITFKKYREWGFFTKNGFVNWRSYNSDMCE
jgi:hypothetical protein